jgi:hypothetical protein
LKITSVFLVCRRPLAFNVAYSYSIRLFGRPGDAEKRGDAAA